MSKEPEATSRKEWFATDVRAIISEFYLHDKVRQARIRDDVALTGKIINYGRYRLSYDEVANIIYVG